MAVYKKYYMRRPVNAVQKWAITVSCLFLLCSTINCTMERVRHHHGGGKQEDDVYVSQLEKTAMEDSSRRPSPSCPNCLYKSSTETKTATDNLRLEAIKRQILSKLGLRQKPNVTHSLPKEVIMQTLYRAEDSQDAFTNMSGEDVPTTSTRTAGLETVDVDDFYGRTSEIISFAEKGKCRRLVYRGIDHLWCTLSSKCNEYTVANVLVYIIFPSGQHLDLYFVKNDLSDV